jgi:hypothetical protein
MRFQMMSRALLALAFVAGLAGEAGAVCVRNNQGGCMRAMTPPPPLIKKKPEPAGCAALPAHCHRK